MKLSRGSALFLLAFGVWSWVIWVTFVKNVWVDERSWAGGSPTGFLIVHLVLTAVSLVLGTIIGIMGWRGYQASRQSQPSHEER